MDLEAGIQIGDFVIEKRLGTGATGIVYRARQVSLDRVVALKVLGNSLVDGPSIRRLRREAQAVAQLDHPGIAAVYHVGQDQHSCYMAMEFVEGVPLDRLIAALAALEGPDETMDTLLRRMRADEGAARPLRFDGPCDELDGDLEVGPEKSGPGPASEDALRLIVTRRHVRRCCELIGDVADALAHAHEQGVVHRDIKPANLIVDPEGRAHVIDFGIARFFDDMTITRTGVLVGTPTYLAPELLTGRVAADHLSDIYSLGLVFYELLALRRPIEATTREAILRESLTRPLKPVSWLNPGVLRELEGIVHMACSKDPDRRYPTAAELAEDLRRFLAGKKVEAPPYRHRLDEREIAAERPGDILALAFTFQFFGILALVVGCAVIFRLADSLPIGSLAFNSIIAGSLACCAWFYEVGRGLLAGRRIARWAALLTCLIGSLASLFYPQFIRVGLALPLAMTPATIALLTVLANAPVLVVVAALERRRCRDWFRFAEGLRAEHSRHLERFSTRRPRSSAGPKPAPQAEV